MAAKHTPGPWRTKSVSMITTEDESFVLADAYGDYDTRGVNAKLIAAAPELLEACEEALRMYEAVQPAGGWQGVYEGLKYAIKKATS